MDNDGIKPFLERQKCKKFFSIKLKSDYRRVKSLKTSKFQHFADCHRVIHRLISINKAFKIPHISVV